MPRAAYTGVNARRPYKYSREVPRELDDSIPAGWRVSEQRNPQGIIDELASAEQPGRRGRTSDASCALATGTVGVDC